jgi:hypothetical protein
MKFIVSIVVTALLAFSMGLILPWWSVAIAGLISGALIPQKLLLALLSSFLAVFLLWGIMALYISISNDHILAHRISILVLKKDNPILLVVFTGLLGGITAGISSLTGRSFILMIKKA